jgi:hypothetical protein
VFFRAGMSQLGVFVRAQGTVCSIVNEGKNFCAGVFCENIDSAA